MATAICLLHPAFALAQATEPGSTAQKQEIQNRVRDMARELVAGILDVQIRQLEENGLESLDLYAEIRSMREHIDELIEAEMPEVIRLLDKLQASPAEARQQAFTLARHKSREILVRLLVERQALLRRLRVAEMVAQVKRLIEMETGVLELAESLPGQSPSRRDAQTLAAMEDQRDVKALYLGLKEMLRDASAWGGPVGAESARGLRLLEAGRVDQEIDNARFHLENARFTETAASLRAVIAGLRSLLQSMERAQGLISGDVDSARQTIRQLAAQQEQVRQATRQPELSRAATDELAQRQSEIRNQLADLREQLPPDAASQPPLKQAEDAAYEATADLFEGRADDALADQQAVLDHLAQAAREAERAAEPRLGSFTAAQYDRLIADLEAAQKDLQEIRKDQEAASESARANPAEARKQETQVAQKLDKVPEGRRLPPQVASRLAEAEQSANHAATTMSLPSRQQQRVAAAREAEQAIERTASEVETALADARRQRLGAEIADLAQAARALDQAAAAERQISHEAEQAAASEGLQAEQAKGLGQRQDDVQDVAAHVAEGVKQAAPKAAQALGEAAQPLAQAADRLQAAAQQPGLASKPHAAEAGRQAEQAAQHIAQAADELRDEIARAAQELAALTGQQLQQATAARQSVEQAIENRPQSLAERLSRLGEAADKVRQAARDQQRAAGRPEAARAQELAAGIRQALQMQDRADRAAEALAQRPEASPLHAVAQQQEVAQAAGQLARQAAAADAGVQRQKAGNQRPESPAAEAAPPATEAAQSPPASSPQFPASDLQPPASQPDALSQSLEQAERAAGKAAQGILDAKPAEAQAARQQTRQALEQALDLAMAAADRALQSPAGEPDAAAQARVGAAAAEAQALAEPDAPQAAATLSQAAQTSQQARKQIEERAPQAAASQEATAGHLSQAETQIADAMDRLAQQVGQQLAQESQQAGRLTDQAIPVTPRATADLQSAENQAADGSDSVPHAPQLAGPVEQGVGQAMDQAVADLLAREQELAGDRALAAALADLAAQQQAAAGLVSQAAQQAPGADQAQASPLASALAQAMQRLGQVQQATIQAAQQVAGQQGAASPSIQQAAALAASLVQPSEAEPSQAGSPMAAGGGSSQQGQFVVNQPSPSGPLQEVGGPPEGRSGTRGSRNQPADTGGRQFLEEPWILRLPPEVRAAIRAGAQRRPPRGYEQRLERYFKNID